MLEPLDLAEEDHHQAEIIVRREKDYRLLQI